MRPRLIILLVDPVEATRAERTFLLDVRGFRVLPLTLPHQALDLLRHPLDPYVRLLFVAEPALEHATPYRELLLEAAQLQPTLATLALPRDLRMDNATLLDRVLALTPRRRGPRPAFTSRQLEAALCHS